MDSSAHYALCQQPSPFDPQIHEQRQFDIYNNGETLSEYSVDTSDVSPQAAEPESQTFFPITHPLNFSPYSMASMSSPYSSASSSSFQSESPPAEPFKTMDSDYSSTIAKPDDFQYSYQSDQYGYSYGNATDMPAIAQPAVYAEPYSQDFTAAPIPVHMTYTSEATKFQPQRYQQWQQSQPSSQRTQPVGYPLPSAQAGRMRSLSDGAPLGPTGNTNGFNPIYAQKTYPARVKYVDQANPEDANFHSTNISSSHTSMSSYLPPFSRLRSFSLEQEQVQQRNTLQAEYVRRARERSMSDAALPRMRPLAYTSSPYPNVYRSFDQTAQTANTHSTTMHSTTPDIQSHASYPQQQHRALQPDLPLMRPMPMAVPTYGLHPNYKFGDQAPDNSGDRQNQDSRPDELSPVLKIRQLEIHSGQGVCEPQYLNANVKGGTGDVIAHGYATSGSAGTPVKEEEEENVMRDEGLQASGAAISDLLDGEGGDEDAEGDCDYDDAADADYEDRDEYDPDDDDDGEFVVPKRRNPAPGNTHSLRTRSATIRSCRFEPYSYSSSSRSTSKPTSSRTTTSRPKTRMRTRHTNSLPVPVPVPNLTKKSRGRRVPTVESLIPPSLGKSGKATSKREGDGGDDKNARTYACDAAGCGKCFARGEHLKRHVRSIHTYEKPHKCPFPGCDKDFSRHDNLRQHLRVHKGYVPVKAEFQGDTEEMW
jgi:hypothetical protein